jgi:hypothetical protein
LMAMYLAKSTWPSGSESAAAGVSSSSGAGGGAGGDNWQLHVDKALVARGNIAEAMLIEKDSGNLLAGTPDFKVCRCHF